MRPKTGKPEAFRRSPCPIAGTLDLLGDKWSLLVIRDMLYGKGTYGELLNSPEGIPTNILADRLRRLEEAGIILRSSYQEHPVRYTYTLSEKGKHLGNVLRALVRWGKTYIPGTQTLDELAPRSRRSRPARRPGRKKTARTD